MLEIVDFSNFDVRSPSELLPEDSNCHKRKPVQAEGLKPPRPTDQGLRLASCELNTLSGLKELVDSALWYPRRLKLLDLSVNKLTSVEELVAFPELQLLYLEGNSLATVQTLLPLTKLEHLTSLSIHGNPLVSQKHFRPWIIATLPQLTRLDNIPITRKERENASQLIKLGAIPMARGTKPESDSSKK
ncbi:putative U2 small nuclear ribonucleoprotein A' [Giardia muris]|uniref:Leucine-rich repeat-containing protein 51 n=1 Tax=Giardia muris TaxID=5742 RepID=A0A4Z1T1W4_GIAMU|nr:putative U2 small nuclear ribonucleoprotein A' [Giardia muris]|eukprot:TNJ26381.1 putative U2 small nuclear ribonucleoprotein A' [Giardia muris]